MNHSSRYVAQSFIFGAFVKIIDTGIKLISVPLLLHYFGKANFGIIALATSINAYINILDLGVNFGAVKFFSEWIRDKNWNLIDQVSRTSLSFYCIIGLVNTGLLLVLAFWGVEVFSLPVVEKETLRQLLFVLSVFTTINWCSSVFSQLLTANESLIYIQKISLVKSISALALVLISLKTGLNLVSYFFASSLLNTLFIVPLYLKTRNSKLISRFALAFDWKSFSIILKYSVSVIAVAFFQMSAASLRPILLSIFSKNGSALVADYRIMETITLFIISIGSIFSSVFLPQTARILKENNFEKVEKFAYKGTLFTSIVCVLLCIPFVLSGEEILTIYVGSEYAYLTTWLNLWLFVILFYLHSTPANSLILAKGKMGALVYSTAISCIISLIINGLLCNLFGAGAAVLGFTVYIAIQMSFYYFYFYKKVLSLNAAKIFSSFIKPAALGIVALLLVYLIDIQLPVLVFQILCKTLVWVVLFILLLLVFRIITYKEIRTLA